MSKNQVLGCGCFVLLVIVNLVFGGMTFNYCLESILGKTVPLVWAVVGGLFLGEATIPLAVLCFICRLAGLAVPFIH